MVVKSLSCSLVIVVYNPNFSGNKLTLDDLGCVLEEVVDISALWYQLGIQLSVRTLNLDRIREQFTNPRDQFLEMLRIWLTTNDNPSWNTLTNALRSQSVGAANLAADLMMKYCSVEGTGLERDTGTYICHLPLSVHCPS